jgi:4-amino-4-deoxy-L-arabinose transferase-like glycosyltransferase
MSGGNQTLGHPGNVRHCPRPPGRGQAWRAVPPRIAVAFLIAFCVLSLGITAPFHRDAEPQSAQWIADIVQHGHWLLPYDYYGFVARKPPLFYWLSALAVDASGGVVDEARTRAVSLIAGAALAAVVMCWSAAEIGEAQGWLAFFLLIGAYGYALRSVTALTDMLLTLLLFAFYCAIYPALEAPPSKSRTALAGTLLGLGILTKGPVVVVIAALASAIYLISMRRNPLSLLTRAWPWSTMAIAFTIAATWYVPAFIVGWHSGLPGTFVQENFGHFVPAALGGTGEAAQPIYFMGLRLFSVMLPASLLIPAVALAFIDGGHPAPYRRPLNFQLAMVVAVLALFSVASAKRADYILPAVPSLASLLAALFIDAPVETGTRARRTNFFRDAITAAIALTMLVGTTASLIFFRSGGSLSSLGMRLQSSDATYAGIFAQGNAQFALPFVLFAIAIGAGSAAVLLGLLRRRAFVSGVGLAALCLAGSMLWNGTVRPAEAQLRSAAPFAAEVRARVGGARVYVAFFDPEFAWYYGSGLQMLPKAVAQSGPSQRQTAFLVARTSELARLSPQVRHRVKLLIESPSREPNRRALYLLQPINPAAG